MKVFKTEKIVLFKTKKNLKLKKRFIIFSENQNLLASDKQQKKQNLIPPQFLRKKTYLFHVDTIEEKNINEGRWNTKEQTAFLEALDKYGVNWKKISASMHTRNGTQIRAHAQKFFKKLKKYKDDTLGIDLTLDSIQNIKDAIKYVKSINSDYSIFNVFSHISGLYDKNNSKRTKKSKQKKNINKIFLDDVNIKNINNVYNNYIIYNKENDINNEKDINQTKNEKSIDNNITTNIINCHQNKAVNKIVSSNSFHNNKNFESIINNDYINHTIINNVVNIIYNINQQALNNYLNNLNNYFNDNVQEIYPFNGVLIDNSKL